MTALRLSERDDMSEQQSIRDEVIRVLDDSDPEGGVFDGAESTEDFWGQQADALLASAVIRRIRASAIRDAAHEVWRVAKDCSSHCDDAWRYRLGEAADRIEKGEDA